MDTLDLKTATKALQLSQVHVIKSTGCPGCQILGKTFQSLIFPDSLQPIKLEREQVPPRIFLLSVTSFENSAQ